MFPKAILHKGKKNGKGLHPICIQVIVNRKQYTKSIAQARLDEWDERHQRVKSSNPNHTLINQLILKELDIVEKKCLQAQIDGIVPDMCCH